jgi:hypothetical protein
LNGISEFGLISFGMLMATGMILFTHTHLSHNSNGSTILHELTIGMILLLLIIAIYFACERRGDNQNSGLIKLAVLPYKFDDLIAWAGYFSIAGFILALILAPSHILLVSGFEFSIAGSILSYLFGNNPGSVVRERRKTLGDGREYLSYQITQLNYCFLYTIVGLSLLIAGIVFGIARIQN